MKHRLSWIGWLPPSAIGVVLMAVYASWFVAYSQLGRRPIPSMDDPKFIGGMSTVVYNIVAWVVLVSLIMWAVGMITNIVTSLLPRTEERMNWILKSAIGMASFFLLFVMMRYSPGDACSWILD
jgi:hypothetical protein